MAVTLASVSILKTTLLPLTVTQMCQALVDVDWWETASRNSLGVESDISVVSSEGGSSETTATNLEKQNFPKWPRQWQL